MILVKADDHVKLGEKAVAQSVERATPVQEVVCSILAAATRSLLVSV